MSVEFVHIENVFIPIDEVKALINAKRDTQKVMADMPTGLVTGGYLSTKTTEKILEILLKHLEDVNFVELTEGLIYYYPEQRSESVQRSFGGGEYNYYAIQQLGDDTVVVKRMNDNKAGDKGSLFVEYRSKVEADFLFGRAVVHNQYVPTLVNSFETKEEYFLEVGEEGEI